MCSIAIHRTHFYTVLSFHTLIYIFFNNIFLQLKELEQENEDIRLRNLRRVRTEEKLHTSSENCMENGGENSSGEKVGDNNAGLFDKQYSPDSLNP